MFSEMYKKIGIVEMENYISAKVCILIILLASDAVIFVQAECAININLMKKQLILFCFILVQECKRLHSTACLLE